LAWAILNKGLIIPSLAATTHFSALAFLAPTILTNSTKLIIFNFFVMAEPLDQRPVRSRKPKIHFDDKIAQSLASENTAKPAKPLKSAPKSTQRSKKPPPTKCIILDSGDDNDGDDDDDVVEELCSQAQELDIRDDPKAKKKAKAAEITCLT
jgi:hypothetical protein